MSMTMFFAYGSMHRFPQRSPRRFSDRSLAIIDTFLNYQKVHVEECEVRFWCSAFDLGAVELISFREN